MTNAQAWNYLGLAYHYAGQGEEAQRAYERALLLDHDLSEAHYNLGCLLLEINKTNAARNELTAFSLRRANSVDGLVKLGISQYRCRDWPAAEKTFHDALRLDAANPEALNGLGLVRLQRGRAGEAMDYFHKALSHNPNFAPALLNAAIVQQQYLKDRTAALQSYRQYAARSAGSSETVAAMIHQLELEIAPAPRPSPSAIAPQPQATVPATVATTSQPVPPVKPPPSNAVKVVVAPRPPQTNIPKPIATSQPPANVDVVHLEPEPVLKPAEDVAPAPKTPAGVTTEGPSPAPPLIAKASEPNPSAKKGLLQKINPMNLFRSDSKPPSSGQTTRESKATPADSNASVVSAAGSTPGDVTRYSYRAPVRPEAGDHSAAEKLFAQGVKAQQARRLAESVQFYRQATQIDPAYFDANYNLGLVSAELGNLEGSLEYYELALAIQPDSLDARYNFALGLKQANYFIDAANELEKILAKHPDESRVHLALGNLYAQQLHQPVAARKHYVKVLETDPRNSQANAIRYWLTSNPP